MLSPSLFRRLPALLALLACLALLAQPRSAGAAPASGAIAPTYHASSAAAGNDIHIRLSTVLWTDGVFAPVERLQSGLAASDLASHSLRGYTVLVALPPGAQAEIVAVGGDVQRFKLSASQPGPAQAGAPAQFEDEPFWLRDQWVARLRLYPLRVDVAAGELLFTPQLQVRLRLRDPLPPPTLPRPDPHWEPIYQQTLVNYADGRWWRRPPAPEVNPLLSGPAPVSADPAWRVRIGVTEPGLQRLTHEDLAALGLELAGLDARRLQLYHQGQKAPLLHLTQTEAASAGQATTSFQPGDSIVFYAPPWSSIHTAEDVFWLALVDGEGQRVASRPSMPTASPLPSFLDTVRLEEQQIYLSDLPPSSNGDRWYWASMRPGRSGAAVRVAPVDLAPVAWGPVGATLRARVVGRDAGRVNVRIALNGVGLGSVALNNRQAALFEASLPHLLLHDGANDILFEVTSPDANPNAAVLDWVEISYQRRFQAVQGRLRFRANWTGAWLVKLHGFETMPLIWDVSDPYQPVQVASLIMEQSSAGAQTVIFSSAGAQPPLYEAAELAAMPPLRLSLAPVQGELAAGEQQVDYLIIAPSALAAAAQRLADHRAGQGLAVKVVALQDIYDAFNAGVAHPEALRAFVRHALAVWPAPAPAYLLLFGHGHYDPRGYVSQTPVQAPVYLRVLDPWLGEVADENHFAAVIGDDPAPDVMLGRLPAQTAAEAELLVDKLIAYDDLAASQPWLQNLLLVADDPDAAGNFYALADDVGRQVSPLLQVRKFYLGATHANPAALRSELLSAWSDGAFMVNYLGHGTVAAWAGGQVLVMNDLPAIQNHGRPAMLLAMASLTGIFYRPLERSLQEELLLLPDGRGVIAYMASTGYGISTGNELVNEGFLQAILYDGENRLGAAALRGKLHLLAQGYGYTLFLAQLFTLIGDPAARLPVDVWSATYYLPLVVR